MAEEKTIEVSFKAEEKPDVQIAQFSEYQSFVEQLRRSQPIGQGHAHTGGADGSQVAYSSLTGTPTIPSLTDVGVIEFTAGETLVAGDIVCIKPHYTDYFPSDDAYVDQANPTTNYGSSTDLKVGSQSGAGNAWISCLKWDESAWPTADKIIQATFNIWEGSKTGSSLTQTVTRNTSTWTGGAVTYNTRPSASDDIDTSYGIPVKTFTTATTGLKTLTFTQLARQWKGGGVTNYGVTVSGGGAAGDTATFVSSENGAGQQPYIRIWDGATTDGKIYKAEARDYLLARNVLGVVVTGGAADATVTVRLYGVSPELPPSTNFGFTFLGENGGTTNNVYGLTRPIKLAKPINALNSQLDITTSGYEIESYATYSGNNLSIYYPAEAKEAVLIANKDFGFSSYKDYQIMKVPLTQNIQYKFGSGQAYLAITVSSGYITVGTSFSTMTIDKITFYN